LSDQKPFSGAFFDLHLENPAFTLLKNSTLDDKGGSRPSAPDKSGELIDKAGP
jgi:hypothetical protein